MKSLYAFLIASLILFITIISGCGKEEVNKTGTKESGNKTETQEQSTDMNQNTSKASETGKIWNQIEKINTSMSRSINSDKPGHLEEPVAEIIILLKGIPEKTTDLTPATLDILKTKVNELRKSGDRLDKYQHSNKSSELKEEYAKFTQILNEIKIVLPE